MVEFACKRDNDKSIMTEPSQLICKYCISIVDSARRRINNSFRYMTCNHAITFYWSNQPTLQQEYNKSDRYLLVRLSLINRIEATPMLTLIA